MFVFNRQINKQYLSEVYADDQEIITVMMTIFLTDSIPTWKSVAELLQQNNYKKAGELVHRIKPSFTMVGLQDFHDPIQELETTLKLTPEPSKIASLYELIDTEIQFILPQIETFLG
jgi:HPt (histidine-containing phosphotransfer) domain-containing protein